MTNCVVIIINNVAYKNVSKELEQLEIEGNIASRNYGILRFDIKYGCEETIALFERTENIMNTVKIKD